MTTKNRRRCQCEEGCEALTTRTFARGHDARLVGRLLRAVANEEMTPAEAYVEASQYSLSLADRVWAGGLREAAKAQRRALKQTLNYYDGQLKSLQESATMAVK